MVWTRIPSMNAAATTPEGTRAMERERQWKEAIPSHTRRRTKEGERKEEGERTAEETRLGCAPLLLAGMKQWKGRFVAMFPAVTGSKTVLYAYRNCLIWRTLHNSACTKGLTIVFLYVQKRTQTPCSQVKRKNQHLTPFALSWSKNNKSRQEST